MGMCVCKNAQRAEVTDAHAAAETGVPLHVQADTAAVIVAGGMGVRFGARQAKQYVQLCGKPMVSWCLMAFDKAPSIRELVIVCAPQKEEDLRSAVAELGLSKPVIFAAAGATRQASSYAGLCATSPQAKYVAIHDAARPLIEVSTIEQTVGALRKNSALAGAICAHPLTDTIKLVENRTIISTPDRSFYWAVQTPQVFKRDELLVAHTSALKEDYVGTDDASLVERCGGRVECVMSPRDNIKVTLPEDYLVAKALLEARLLDAQSDTKERHLTASCTTAAPNKMVLPLSTSRTNALRIGHGYDVHAFAPDRACILGGVNIPYELGLLGHSDADVVTHALMDAILGALRAGDIGELFPDNNPAYKGANSLKLLAEVIRLMHSRGYELVDADITIAAQAPKLAPYKEAMCQNLTDAMGVSRAQVGVKATTTEKLGFVGKKEGIAAWAVVLLQG